MDVIGVKWLSMSVSFPHGAARWSALYVYGIFWSYALTFYHSLILISLPRHLYMIYVIQNYNCMKRGLLD